MMHALPRMYINIIEVIVMAGKMKWPVATAPSPSASLCILSHVVCAASINGRAYRPGSGTKCMARTNKSECIQISNIQYQFELHYIVSTATAEWPISTLWSVDCALRSHRFNWADMTVRNAFILRARAIQLSLFSLACVMYAPRSSPHRTAHTPKVHLQLHTDSSKKYHNFSQRHCTLYEALRVCG